MNKTNTLGIYIHIPFCIRKCAYCDFLSAPPENEKVMHEYVECLCNEIILKSKSYTDPAKEEMTVDTIFFGGGTPSVLSAEDFNFVLQTVRQCFKVDSDAEITVECNPDTVDLDKLRNYKIQGVNRISFGLQSASDDELKMLGRIHSYEKFLESYENARKAGFTNVNVDLISAIPGQTPKGWEKTLRKVAELNPEHISAYSLILEEGTRLFEEKDLLVFPTEDEDVQMYESTAGILDEYGYKRYEISNYAKVGKESSHNNKYWQRNAYLGFGLGAASFMGNKRFSNIRDMDGYKRAIFENNEPVDETEILSKEESMAEFFYLGLRRMAGVLFADFEKEFCEKPLEVYGDVINKLIGQGLLEFIKSPETSDIGIRLTNEGIFLSNRVFMEFV